ncbi:MAG: FAD-binding oxidoreductase [Endomicrobia bacterium]|nr:FAD-binding oxidoreductase [Endomicrobiia bacterium]MCX7715926.1 FAD-binding oxidoreductase [Endomicrobiia bacterium]
MNYNKVDNNIMSKLKSICGENNVIVDKDKLIDYTHDEYPSYQQEYYPEVVVKPHTVNQVAEILKVANENFIPVTPRGAATGLAGGCVPIYGGIVLSVENMNKILEIDKQNFVVVAEAGVPLMKFFKEIEHEGLFFPPHPGDESAMLGGVVATNAGGARAVKYGVIRNFVRGLEVVLPDGKIIQCGGKLVKNSSGYSLLNLFIGSEGTLGIITKVILAVVAPSKSMVTLVVPYENIETAIKTVPEILSSGVIPMAIEFLELEPIILTEKLLNKTWPTKQGKAQLMLIIDAQDEDTALSSAEKIAEVCQQNNAIEVFIADTSDKQHTILEIRSHIYESLKSLTVDILDVAVPPAKIAEFVNRIHEIETKYGIWLPTYGHAGDGNVHTHYMKGKFQNGELVKIEEAEWKTKMDQVITEVLQSGINLGGTITGEHGVGLIKKKYMSMMYPQEYLDLLRKIKKIFDPNNILNPGKIL